MKFVKNSLKNLVKNSTSTPIKSVANGIIGYAELPTTTESEIFSLINENFSKYKTDKNVKKTLKAINSYKKGNNLKITESLLKIGKAKNVDEDLKLTVAILSESLQGNNEFALRDSVIKSLKPYRWNNLVKESLEEIEIATKENGLLAQLNDCIDKLLEDETGNEKAIQILTWAYSLPETDIRHYLLSEFADKTGIYPEVDDLLKNFIKQSDTLDVETIRFNIDRNGRYPVSTPIIPVLSESKRKLFLLHGRIFESFNGKISIINNPSKVPTNFLKVCESFVNLKSFNDSKSLILESKSHNKLVINEDGSGDGYQIQLNGSNLGTDFTTYESEIKDIAQVEEIPTEELSDFIAICGNINSIAMVEDIICVDVNDSVCFDIIRVGKSGYYINVYDKTADNCKLMKDTDTENITAVEDEYGLSINEFLNEDDETEDELPEEIDNQDNETESEEIEQDKETELKVALQELKDQLDEAQENYDNLQALDEDYKDEIVTGLIDKIKNTIDQLSSEIKEIEIQLGADATITNESAAKFMVDLEGLLAKNIDIDSIENNLMDTGESTNIGDYLITPVAEFLNIDGNLKLGGLFLRIDSANDSDITEQIAGKFNNLMDGNMLPLSDEVTSTEFEQFKKLEGKIDQIIQVLETDNTESQEETEIEKEQPNESFNKKTRIKRNINESKDSDFIPGYYMELYIDKMPGKYWRAEIEEILEVSGDTLSLVKLKGIVDSDRNGDYVGIIISGEKSEIIAFLKQEGYITSDMSQEEIENQLEDGLTTDFGPL